MPSAVAVGSDSIILGFKDGGIRVLSLSVSMSMFCLNFKEPDANRRAVPHKLGVTDIQFFKNLGHFITCSEDGLIKMLDFKVTLIVFLLISSR